MQGGKRPNGTRAKRGRSPEPHIGAATFNPGPDSDERRWRFFNLAVRLVTGDRSRPIRIDPSTDGRHEERV